MTDFFVYIYTTYRADESSVCYQSSLYLLLIFLQFSVDNAKWIHLTIEYFNCFFVLFLFKLRTCCCRKLSIQNSLYSNVDIACIENIDGMLPTY